MRIFGHRANGMLLAVSGTLWFLYACLELRHFYDVAIRVPPEMRVVREAAEVRLPKLYFCPADRGNQQGFRWHSSECRLKYRDERKNCMARVERYHGREPEEFLGRAGDAKDGGACLLFSTHMVGVKEEWSAAWNEVSLRAAFEPPENMGLRDALREVELGYLASEWERGMRESSTYRYYYPLLRVPYFFMNDGAGVATGVATRTFLGEETDRDPSSAEKRWYTYGAMQIVVANATLPAQQVLVEPGTAAPSRLGVVHIVITLEDFSEYIMEFTSPFFPFLQMIGRVAGTAALVVWLIAPPRLQRSSGGPVKADEEDLPSGSPRSPDGIAGGDYDRVTTRENEDDFYDDEEAESQALLGGSGGAPARPSRGTGGGEAGRRSDSRAREDLADQALLGTEGTDGL